MSYIKIQKIKKEDLNGPEFTPEKGYVYLGYDDDTVDGVSSGLWLKNDDGTTAYYILAQNDAKPKINHFFPNNYANNSHTISIWGENFIPFSTNVTFGGVAGINVTVLSSIQLTVIVPDVSGTVDVVVSTGYGYSDPKDYTIAHINIKPIIIPPIIPSEAGIGANITINGANFVVGDTITWFGGVSGTTTVLNSTLLTATIPQTNTGQTIVFLENISLGDGVGNSVDYFINNTNVTFTNFYPTYGYIGNTISISGTNFVDKQIQVCFGSTQASDIIVHNSTYLTAKISPNTPFGETTIRVNSILLNGFTVTGSTVGLLPTITSITPLSSHTGETLTILGTNLGGALSITFSDVNVPILSNLTDQAIVYLTSSVIAGANSVYAVNKYGRSEVPYIYRVASNVMGGPVITSFSPPNDYRNAAILINGQNFIVGSNNMTYFGNVNSPQTQCSISTEYRAIISPSSPTGLVDIKVINVNGSYTMTGFTINDLGASRPIITSITPSYAKAGDIITIYGENLDQAIISLGQSYPGFNTTTTPIDSNHLTAIVPSGLVNAGENKLYTVYATTPTGTTSFSPIEIYALPLISPTITAFSPISGSIGTLITISGANFSQYWTDASIYIGGVYYILNSQTFISSEKITGYIPDTNGNFGAATIKISTPIGISQKSTFTISNVECDLEGIIDCYYIE